MSEGAKFAAEDLFCQADWDICRQGTREWKSLNLGQGFLGFNERSLSCRAKTARFLYRRDEVMAKVSQPLALRLSCELESNLDLCHFTSISLEIDFQKLEFNLNFTKF